MYNIKVTNKIYAYTYSRSYKISIGNIYVNKILICNVNPEA